MGSEREQHLNSPTILPSEQTTILCSFSTPGLEPSKLCELEGLKKENNKLKTGLEEALEQFKSLRDEAKNTARAEDSRINIVQSTAALELDIASLNLVLTSLSTSDPLVGCNFWRHSRALTATSHHLRF